MGEYHHNIDAKGRLIIPAKFREQLGEEAVFTRGMDGCIFGYSKTGWSNVEDKLSQLSLTKKKMHELLLERFMRVQWKASSINRVESILVMC